MQQSQAQRMGDTRVAVQVCPPPTRSCAHPSATHPIRKIHFALPDSEEEAFLLQRVRFPAIPHPRADRNPIPRKIVRPADWSLFHNVWLRTSWVVAGT